MAARAAKRSSKRAGSAAPQAAPEQPSIGLHSLMFSGLLVLAVATGLAIVERTHDVRQLYQQLTNLQLKQDALLEERSRLLLERGATTQLQNIEGVASDELGMVFPEALGGVIE